MKPNDYLLAKLYADTWHKEQMYLFYILCQPYLEIINLKINEQN